MPQEKTAPYFVACMTWTSAHTLGGKSKKDEREQVWKEKAQGKKIKSLPFPRSVLLVSAHHSCWSQIKEAVGFSVHIFSGFVGYWLYNLIKAVTK